MTDAPIPVLAGPTASGKTGLALELAERLDAEIVSVDSRQVYRGMEIGSAAPTPEERARVPHHLVGIRDPEEPLSAGAFGELAAEVLDDLRTRGKTPLLVGGSGLYLRAALGGLDDTLPAHPAMRASLEARADAEGLAALHAELLRVDPATRIAPADRQRIVRALELHALTGAAPSELQRRGKRTTRPARVAVLHWPVPVLEQRIRARVRAMIEGGLEGEVQALLDRGVPADRPLWRSMGYAETLALFRGELDREAWEERIVVHTRRYGKRQRTWFRGLPGAVFVDVDPARFPDAARERVQAVFAGAV